MEKILLKLSIWQKKESGDEIVGEVKRLNPYNPLSYLFLLGSYIYMSLKGIAEKLLLLGNPVDWFRWI